MNNGNTTAGVNAWYPGSAYVDVVSLDAYPPNVSEDTPVYNALVATGKPVMYAETGVHSFNNSAVSLLTYDNTSILATIKANFPKIFAVVIWCQNYALYGWVKSAVVIQRHAAQRYPRIVHERLKALP